MEPTRPQSRPRTRAVNLRQTELGGTVLVEGVFDWPGIGLYAAKAAVSSDFEPIMAVTLVLGGSFMIVNLLIDLAYAMLDPRVRSQV